jgi:DNA repair protein RecO (recombination protein O)
MNQIEVRGMVISAMPIGEFDKRLVLLTREKGKITVFAKGARRQSSPYLAGTQPFCFGTFTVYASRSSYGLTGISISEYFLELTQDIVKTYYGFYFLELADYFAREGIDGKDTLNLLYAALRALEKGTVPPALIRRVYELKTLVFQGMYPDFFSCRHCGNGEQLYWYVEKQNGIFCEHCKGVSGTSWKLLDSTVYTLQYIIGQPIEKLFSFQVKDEVFSQLERVVKGLMHKYVNKSFHSLDVLSTLTES